MNASTLKRGMMVAAAVLATSATQALAQDISDERLGDFEERIEEFQTRLGLTDEQLEEMRPVIAENFEKILLAFDEAGLEQGGGGASSLGRRDRIRLGRQIRGIQEETDKKMRDILTDEQMDEYEEIQEERREELRARIQGGGR
jgi:Spy/CpxP family protein refolding chaperone